MSLCYDVGVNAAGSPVHADLSRIAAATPGLGLLLLYGSRARGDARTDSDWDFGYEADSTFDPDALLARLADELKADKIDLTDLNRAGALLRHRAARHAVVLFEQTPGRFTRFWLNAVDTWCDLAPILEPIYAGVLEGLER